MFRTAGSRAGLFALACAATLAITASAQGEIVANLGTLSPGASEIVSCNTSPSCTTTTGTAGGSLPANTAGADTFTHQIIFSVSTLSTGIASTQILDNTSIDTANMTVQLFAFASGSTAVGGTANTGALLATAISSTFATTTNFFLSVAGLDPTQTYILQLIGAGAGVQASTASYGQQIGIAAAVSPVPLPPALFLFAAALAGLVGYTRIQRHAAARK